MQERATIYIKLQPSDGWETEEKTTYDARKLADQYRQELYSEKAKELFLSKNAEAEPTKD